MSTPQTAPRRTPAGDAAVARHAPELATAARVVLAAIDGRRGLAALEARFGALVAVEATLKSLAQAQLIEWPAPDPTAAPPALETQPLPSVAPGMAALADPFLEFDLVGARLLAIRGIAECLGPSGDVLMLRFEGCRSAEEFRRLHKLVCDQIRVQRGTDGLARFLQWSPEPR